MNLVLATKEISRTTIGSHIMIFLPQNGACSHVGLSFNLLSPRVPLATFRSTTLHDARVVFPYSVA